MMRKLVEPVLISGLIVCILVLISGFILSQPETPVALETSRNPVTVIEVNDRNKKRINDLGKVNVFQPLLPEPVMVPPPPPPPLENPEVKQLIRDWKLVGIGESVVEIEFNKKIFEYKLNEIIMLEFKKREIPLRLQKIDLKNFKIELSAPKFEKDWSQDQKGSLNFSGI